MIRVVDQLQENSQSPGGTMFTKEYIQLMTAYCDEMDSECPWTRHMSFEQILDEIYTYAQEIDDYLVVTVLINNELNNEDSEVDYCIHLYWKKEYGFYSNGHRKPLKG